jgi:Uma2 family endonuclease
MVTTRLMTAAELAMLPDDGYHYELVRGELRRMPLPGQDHGEFIGYLAFPLMVYARTTGLVTVFFNDTGFWLERDPDTVRGPDLAVVLTNRLTPRPRPRYATVRPDLAAEFASPSDRRSDIEEKIDDYLRAGVPLIWYFFPETKTVWVDGAGRERVVLTETDVLDGSDVLPGLPPIPIADIFR